jgi:hypothetical protein
VTALAAEEPLSPWQLSWLETERRVRSVVARAIREGTLDMTSDWYEMTEEEYLAIPIPPMPKVAWRPSPIAPRRSGAEPR